MTRRRQTSANLICVCMYDCMYLSISEEADLGKLDLLDGGHLLLLKLVKRYQHCCAIVSIIPHDCLCVSVCCPRKQRHSIPKKKMKKPAHR